MCLDPWTLVGTPCWLLAVGCWPSAVGSGCWSSLAKGIGMIYMTRILVGTCISDRT